MYTDDDLLMLSGIQHIAFCERQYALIYIEQQWVENILTAEGRQLHDRVDDPFENEKRPDKITWRSVAIVSYQLGLRGVADLVELHKCTGSDQSKCIRLPAEEGAWKIVPVEYKRGKPKPDYCDEVQLCAQAICLEEMHQISISCGFIYYGKTHHRYQVDFNEKLRNTVNLLTERMHQLQQAGVTPPPIMKSGCGACSLREICLPDVISAKRINDYLNQLWMQ